MIHGMLCAKSVYGNDMVSMSHEMGKTLDIFFEKVRQSLLHFKLRMSYDGRK